MNTNRRHFIVSMGALYFHDWLIRAFISAERHD